MKCKESTRDMWTSLSNSINISKFNERPFEMQKDIIFIHICFVVKYQYEDILRFEQHTRRKETFSTDNVNAKYSDLQERSSGSTTR